MTTGPSVEAAAVGHDLDEVLATGDLEVLGDVGVAKPFEDEVAAGVDIDGRRVACAVQDADLGHVVGHLVLGCGE